MEVVYEKEGHVAKVGFNHPTRKNLISSGTDSGECVLAQKEKRKPDFPGQYS